MQIRVTELKFGFALADMTMSGPTCILVRFRLRLPGGDANFIY
jgi:hypothetical protein